ncbi:MAG: tetratricopeptide repeat protein [Hyphomicrobium sp.]|nr:tetratricopeptide repeat protein [Hyphomicrobium sp.]
MAFQAKHNLRADGIVGPNTFRAIVGGSAEAGDAAMESPVPLTVSDRLEILDALGNIMRARKRYADAIPYYDRALALVTKPERRHWVYYYARGTSYERLKNWDAAEVDLEKALSLYPDQPLILNYLGYSWIDQGRKLKEGMAHIEKAVALKPDDGYIVDSLGWAHYMQGNFQEAVRYLERAVELKPDDPVLNDHLGDALWRVGREREARYQWDQALSLKPEPEDEAKIRKKLETGLTGVQLPHAGEGTGKQAAKAGDSDK